MPSGQQAILIQLAYILFRSWKCLSFITLEYPQFLISEDRACNLTPKSHSEEIIWPPPTHTFPANPTDSASLQLHWDRTFQSIICLVEANNICFYHIMFLVIRKQFSEAETTSGLPRMSSADDFSVLWTILLWPPSQKITSLTTEAGHFFF